METLEFSTLQELAQDAIDKLNDGVGVGVYGCDLHNDLFNSDYFIIGYYESEKWLTANGGCFTLIGLVQDYETDNFGQVSTDLSSSEKVANMVAYIGGETVLSESDTLQNKWDVKLSEKDIKKIVKELKNAYSL